MKRGDLVRIIAPPSICFDLTGKIGIVLEYLDIEEYDLAWFPIQPIVVILVGDETAFFYADEIEIINIDEE